MWQGGKSLHTRDVVVICAAVGVRVWRQQHLQSIYSPASHIRIPHLTSASRIRNPESGIPYPVSRILNPASRIPNPESRIFQSPMIENPPVTEERIRVRYGETDQMGHAYYANYLYWFEQARGTWCRSRGFTYKTLEESGYFLPVVEVHVRYRGEVRYDENVLVRVWVSEIKRAAIKFEYEVMNEAGQLVTQAHTWHVLMGSERKAISIPPQVKEMLGRSPNEFN